MQWREIALPVETLRLSCFYWPRLSTTPTIVIKAQGKKLMRAPVVCLVASASTETVLFYVFAGTGSSGPPPSTLDSMFGGHWTSLLDELLSLSS